MIKLQPIPQLPNVDVSLPTVDYRVPQMPQVRGRIEPINIERHIPGLMQQPADYDAAKATARGGALLAGTLENVGGVFERLGEQLQKSKDLSDLSRANNTMSMGELAFEEEALKNQWQPAEKMQRWNEEWRPNIQGKLQGMQLSPGIAERVALDFQLYDGKKRVELQGENTTKLLEDQSDQFKQDYDTRIQNGDTVGAISVSQNMLDAGLQNNAQHEKRVADANEARSEWEFMRTMNAMPRVGQYEMEEAIREGKSDMFPEITNPATINRLYNLARGEANKREVDTMEEITDGIAAGNIKDRSHIESAAGGNLTEDRIDALEKSLNANPAFDPYISTVMTTSVESYDLQKDGNSAEYHQLHESITTLLPKDVSQQLIGRLHQRIKDQREGNLPGPIERQNSELNKQIDDLGRKGYFGPIPDVERKETWSQEQIDQDWAVWTKVAAAKETMRTWMREHPEEAADPTKTMAHLKSLIGPSVTESAGQVITRKLQEALTRTIPVYWGTKALLQKGKEGVETPGATPAPIEDRIDKYRQGGGGASLGPSGYPASTSAISEPLVKPRSALSRELAANPALQKKLFALTAAEVGGQGTGAQQALMETIFNRAAARGQTLDRTMAADYYEPLRKGRLPKLSEAQEKAYAKILERVLAGSNVSNYATGNWSGAPGKGLGGPRGYLTRRISGEQFSVQSADVAWARQFGEVLMIGADLATIDDATAEKYLNDLEAGAVDDAVKRVEMENALFHYSDAQKEQRRAARFQHYEKLLTDEGAWQGYIRQPEITEAQKYVLKPDDVPYQTFNQQFLSDVFGQELSGPELALARDGYAKEKWGAASVDDRGFYELNKKSFLDNKAKREALGELIGSAVVEGAEAISEGRPTEFASEFYKWREKNKEWLDGSGDEAEYYRTAIATLEQTKEGLQEFGPQISTVLQTLTKYTQGEATRPDVINAARGLVGIPKAQRDQIYGYVSIAAKAQSLDLSAFEQAAKNFGQEVSRGYALPQEVIDQAMGNPSIEYLEQVAIARLRTFETGKLHPMLLRPEGVALRTPEMKGGVVHFRTEDERNAAIAGQREFLETLKIARELEQLAVQGVDPTKPVLPEGGFWSLGTIERGIYGTGGSLGYMSLSAINPVLGFLAIRRDEYNKIRLEYDKLDPEVAGMIATGSAALQAPIEYLQVPRIGKKLPLTAQLMQALPNQITRRLVAMTGGLAKQNLEEAVQDAISSFGPALVARLRADMPDKDLGPLGKEWLEQRPTVFWSLAIPGLVDGGFADLSDFKNPAVVLSEKMMMYRGYSAEAIARVNSSQDKAAALRAEAPNRTATDIRAGIEALQRDLLGAEADQENPNRPTLERVQLPDGTSEWHVLRNQGVEERARAPIPQENLEGKVVSLSLTDPQSGVVQQVSMPAEEAYGLVSQKVGSYLKLIDCLSK